MTYEGSSTKRALRRYTGRDSDGLSPEMSRIAGRLQAEQAARQASLMERTATLPLRQAGPMQAAVDKARRQALRDEMDDPRLPICTRADLAQLASDAYRAAPNDRGLKRLAGLTSLAYQDDPFGNTTIGHLHNMRDVISREFGRSAALDLLGPGLARVAYTTNLPVRKLAEVAAEITGSNEEEMQESYHDVVARHHLQGQDTRSVQARAFIRGLVELRDEKQVTARRSPPSGAEALERALNRYAQMMEEEPEMGDLEMPDEMLDGPVEEDPLAVAEEIDDETLTFPSPLTGEELEVELRMADPEDPMGTEEITDDDLGDMAFVGQIEDVGLIDDSAFETEVEDPSAPGEMLRLTVEPAEPPEDEMSSSGLGTGQPLPDTGMGVAASRAYEVYAVSGGRRHPVPVMRLLASRMRGALGLLRNEIGPSDRGVPVLAGRRGFAREALVVLDAPSRSYFLVRAAGDVFGVDVPSDGQVVEHNVDVPKDGAEALKSNKEHKQHAPAAVRQARPLTREQVGRVCKRFGLSRPTVLDRLLNGEQVQAPRFASGWSLDTDDSGNVVLAGPGTRKRAAITHAEVLIDEWLARVASLAYQTAPEPHRADVSVRPLFQAVCAACDERSEYLMPDEPTNIRCGSCGYETDAEAVGHQLRAAPFYTGWVITTEVPLVGGPERFVDNAQRMVRAVQKIVPHVEADLRPEHADLQMVVRGASEAAVNRIRLVLEDMFGVQRLVAQDLGIEDDGDMGDMGDMGDDGDMGMTAQVAEIPMDPMLTPMDAPIPESPASQLGMPLVVEDPLNDEQVEQVQAAFTYFRAQGRPILQALDTLTSDYRDMLDSFGPEGSPMRSAAEVQIAEMALAAYEKPAITTSAAARVTLKGHERKAVEGRMKQLKLPKPNTQQPDAVNVGKADKVLGKDTTGKEPSVFNVKPKTKHKPQGKLPNWEPESESESRDPGRFGADKPSAHNSDPKSQRGTSLPSTEMGKDSTTGENALTRKMDSLSSGAKAQPNKRSRTAAYEEDDEFYEGLDEILDEAEERPKSGPSKKDLKPGHPDAPMPSEFETSPEPGLSVRNAPMTGDDFLDGDMEPDHELTAKRKTR